MFFSQFLLYVACAIMPSGSYSNFHYSVGRMLDTLIGIAFTIQSSLLDNCSIIIFSEIECSSCVELLRWNDLLVDSQSHKV